ncbi:NmrA family NAD(P)-binding protein [Leptothoe spongobia]|uniref:NmrA family NAD(P)-binding protein n=1 Tax=Leptothoe spongobia TAU-MAC 1115 TaxID=1967444 RepID=A0A947DGY6_9CYAN|nr:NmrA family NAD(P)-binding protein [Leptothoe spongobia]MBT9316882.1 NmrA family NAD(P)-binding protein [Leptothoe spongobia TAU-MAC 1115]
MTLPKILITNANGKTGFAATLQLLAKGYPVRAFVRTQRASTVQLKQAGAEILIGNMADMATLTQAMQGIERAYLCLPGMPNPLFSGVSFAVAAQAAQLDVVVMMGQWLSHPQHPSFATRVINLMDSILSWMPDVGVVTINPGWFADNYMAVLEPIAQLGLMPMPLGQGLNPAPSNEDIARVIVGALINPAAHIGKTYRPTGPKLLAPEAIANTFSRVLNRPVKYIDISETMFLKALRVQGFSPFLQAQMRHYAEEYRRNAFGTGGPTNAVLEVGGQPPEEFETIVHRYVANSSVGQRSLTHQLRAVKNLAQILLTPVTDIDGYERRQDLPRASQPTYVLDDNAWVTNHRLAGAFGFTNTPA